MAKLNLEWPTEKQAESTKSKLDERFLHLHLVIFQMLLFKATYNWGIHKAIHLEEANRQRKCS